MLQQRSATWVVCRFRHVGGQLLCRAEAANAKLDLQVEAANTRYSNLAKDSVNVGSELERAACELTQAQALLAESRRAHSAVQADLEDCRATGESQLLALHQELAAADAASGQERCNVHRGNVL
jgi:multidrug resistance efflux pump